MLRKEERKIRERLYPKKVYLFKRTDNRNDFEQIQGDHLIHHPNYFES